MIRPERFIAIDWSGAARVSTQRKHIWTAEASTESIPFNKMTRDELCEWVIEDLSGTSAVIGFDFAFSFPISFFRQKRLSSVGELWELAEERGETWLGECEPPFWGRPGKPRPPTHNEEGFRETDKEINIGGIVPKSPLQIGGAGAVGTGAVRGMPILKRLRHEGFSIWPFDPPSLPMVLEIYPRLLTGAVNKSDPNARASYPLIRELPDRIQGIARSSEDAFDAIVSANVMKVYCHKFESLKQATNPVQILEGQIWAPGS